MQITATAYDSGLWAVRLETTGAVGRVDWYRRRAGAETHIGAVDGDGVLWDYKPELGLTYEYVAVDDVDSVTSPPVSITSSHPILSSTTSAIARRVTVVEYRPYRGDGRSVWHPVLGRNDPLVTIHPALYPQGTLRLWAADNDERLALIDMLRLGEPLHLRTTCSERLDSMHLLMLSWSDPFPNDRRRSGPCYIDIEFQAMSDTPGIVPPDPGRTYQTVLDAHDTYQDVLITWPTYRALLDG